MLLSSGLSASARYNNIETVALGSGALAEQSSHNFCIFTYKNVIFNRKTIHMIINLGVKYCLLKIS